MSLLRLLRSPAAHPHRRSPSDLPASLECSLSLQPLHLSSCQEQHCPLGRWLHGSGQQHFARYEAFQQLRSGHQALHDIASEIQVLHEIGRRSDARQLHNGEFTRTLHHVQQRLLALKALG